MKCPHCGADNDRVIDSRASHDGAAIRRRRECLACQTRYNTFERVDDPMRCPFCHAESNRMVEAVGGEGGFAIRRRRECLVCRRSYTTLERSEERSIKVVKKDGARVPFDRQKIKQGLEKACWKRPVSDEQLEMIVSAIETEVHGKFEAEVESSWLGELSMQHLRGIDQVAYVRFASVYREFEDARDFAEELEPMLAERRGDRPAPTAPVPQDEKTP
ncbi:MAG TPA: transcriptional regulator NrdR [Pirellulales bacterium]|nr:transcriptional regulator NrdR [Pirellulales bacterium]